MADKYTVVAGDTLSELAQQFHTTVGNLVKWNDITDPDYIVVGQKLSIDGTNTTSSNPKLSSRAEVKVFGLQADTDRTVYASWKWDQDHTENYQVRWYYLTMDNFWFVGSEGTEDFKQATYDAPSNAVMVKFHVKPIAEKHTVNKQEVSYWSADWSTEIIYDFTNNPPTTPSAPTVTVDKYNLTASLANLPLNIDKTPNATHIQFQIVKNDSTVFKTGTAAIITQAASYSCTVGAGAKYKVRARAYHSKLNKYSDWSDYSANVETIPSAPAKLTSCYARSETSVYLAWNTVANAKTYDIEYTTKREYFDTTSETTTVTGVEGVKYEKTGLETGEEYFFRVRAVNSAGTSGWSAISSTVIGKAPAAPTTWSSTTTAITGENINLYWVHNSEDGSSQTYADLELYINGVRETHTVVNSTDEDEKDKTSVYKLNTSSFTEGSKILWRVRTAGITNTYGDWSVQRTIDVYAPPTLGLNVTDVDGETLTSLTTFPFYIAAEAGPDTQLPIGYHVTVLANEAYETVDYAGNPMIVSAGDEVYSKYFDTSTDLVLVLSASDLNLENNITYTVKCVVSMNSGLTAEETTEFKVAWTDKEYYPNAEIGIDKDSLTAYVRPYCETYYGGLIEGITLSVYRREFDGSFTELATGIDNLSNTYITDPHPALDFARYRIVAMENATGAISYYDAPGYPVGETAVIIQWDEAWKSFDTTSEDPLEEQAWAGSLLRLPYNIDVTNNIKPDVSHVEYIGRKHPVSYYGTHVGATASWSVEIEKADVETIYALRRLQNYMGDVYVREPSGVGYWASITVSFTQTHLAMSIPVNLEIVRVEGGA